jgi:hypothetical protein
MKEKIASSAVIGKAVEDGKLKILSVCVDGSKEQWQAQKLPIQWIDARDEKNVITDRELYDLPSLPVMYLLDRSCRVILKNTTLEKLEAKLKELAL